MDKSTLFIRGQVWYWEDPIYGPKENNIDISIGEATMRYNRYCIVAQTTETIGKSSLLVIPCSSSCNTPYDIPVPLSHLFHDNYSYARIKEIFPVHPKYLQRYICTLSDDVMKQIEGELAKLLMPSIIDTFGKDGFKDLFGFDFDMTYHKPIKNNYNALEMNVRLFIKEHLVKTDNDNDIISAYELKDAYDQFCMKNNFDPNRDIIEFLDMFTKLTTNTSYDFIVRSKFNVINFKGIKLRGDITLSIMMGERDLINPDDPQKPGKWNDESIDEFLNEYNKNGVEVASEKFGLKQSTATSYWYKWKDRLVVDNSEPLSIVPRIPSTKDVQKSISKISNFIRDDLKEHGLYYKSGMVLASDNKIIIYENMPEGSFYNKLGVAIYYSFIDLLSIKIVKHTPHIPAINSNSKYLDTWHFFDKAYHDKRISMCTSMNTLIESYVKYFPKKKYIDKDLIKILKEKIISRIDISSDSADIICKLVETLYCKY